MSKKACLKLFMYCITFSALGKTQNLLFSHVRKSLKMPLTADYLQKCHKKKRFLFQNIK